ncbi:hypothetical protein MHK_009435 [Candidatus Magnetomorum sp. HK-1]|nr:hypothetical protein MHK_009435 [Candidatus Magnetomorum sp. HK-1]
MNSCIEIEETMLSYFSETMPAELRDPFFTHLSFCKQCRSQFIDTENLIHACKDLQWAQIPYNEAHKMLEKLTPKKMTTRLKEKILSGFNAWITETFPLKENSIFFNEPCLAPFRGKISLRSARGDDSLRYRLITINNQYLVAKLFFECEKVHPFSFGVQVLNVISKHTKASFRFTLWKNNQLIVSHPVSQQAVLETNLLDGEYHIRIKQNAQDIYQFDFTINEKGLMYD